MPLKFRRNRPSPDILPQPSVEYIDVVDDRNRPLAVMPIDEVHAQALRHRAVAVMVYDADGKVYLQKRSMSKSRFPGLWDLSATGHVTAGEAVEDAAARELHEELGLAVNRLRFIASVGPGPATGWEFVSIYSAGIVLDTPRPNPEEVDGGYFVDRAELGCMVKNFSELLTPALIHFWEGGLIFGSLP